jgi:tetratricopeptide (TPR) repeat protein
MEGVLHCFLRFISLFTGVVVCSLHSNAQIPFTTQPEKTETRNGNKQFNKGNYSDAEACYKKALDKKSNMPEATFNLGDAVYQQKRYEEAIKQFQLSAQTNTDPTVKAKAYHNLGNAYMEGEKWEEAVKAYKNALKLKPSDADTKYNLAYANEKLRQKQSGEGGKNEQKDKQQNKDKQDQNKEQQQQDKNEQSKEQQKSDNKEQQKQQQGQQPKLSKEEAEQLLNAINNEEQKTNQKVQQKQVKAVNVKILKDW